MKDLKYQHQFKGVYLATHILNASDDELKSLLQKLSEQEKYDDCVLIRDELNRRHPKLFGVPVTVVECDHLIHQYVKSSYNGLVSDFVISDAFDCEGKCSRCGFIR